MTKPPPLPVLFVDEHLIVVNKPSGLAVHRGWDRDVDFALTRVRDALGEHVDPVHRLDRATSGALLFSRTPEMSSALGKLAAEGGLDKKYVALVRGHTPASGIIDHAIPRREDGPRVPAITHYRQLAISALERVSLVEAEPRTGRLHQVRRHLKHISHPLIGDVNYGRGELNRHFRARYALHRLALHAHALAFTHPATGVLVEVFAPVPEDLRAPLLAIGFDPSIIP